MHKTTKQSAMVTSNNIEQTSLFLLNCKDVLFKENATVDPLRHKREVLQEKYRRYKKAVLNSSDIAREERINQIKQALEEMLGPACELIYYLTETGLQQLSASLEEESAPRFSKKKRVSEMVS